MDDVDSHMVGHNLKLWTDRYKVRGEIKGSQVALKHKLFIITSNYTIEECFERD